MADDTRNRSGQDRARVNIHERYERSYWSRRFGVSEEDLERAVGQVGPMVADLERFFGRS